MIVGGPDVRELAMEVRASPTEAVNELSRCLANCGGADGVEATLGAAFEAGMGGGPVKFGGG